MNGTGAATEVVAQSGVAGESLLLRPLTLGILTAVIFAVLASIRLTAQGVNQDELHQAAGAFAWRGGPLLNYAEMTVRGLPVLNMSYSGAIKTALYGLYLRFTARRFSVLSWRATGILIASLALLAFYLLAGRRWPPAARLVFAVLVLSDPNILLLQRHDYGPVAIGFFLRMLFLAVWLRQLDSSSRDGSSFALGVLAGLAAFEKLSSLVLLLPFLLAIMVPLRRATPRRFAAAALGAAIGFLPLVAVNLHSFKVSGTLISLSAVERTDHTLESLVRSSGALLSLGAGARARDFLLGEKTSPVSQWLEGVTLGALLVLSIAAAGRGKRDVPMARLALLCGLSFLLVGLGTWLLPAPVDVHHWVLATPFQYVAIALTVSAAFPLNRRSLWPAVVGILIGSVFLANRASTFASTVGALFEEKSSLAYDPSLTRLGEFARRARDETAFIVADWGVSIPMFCISDGAPGRIFDIYWYYRGPKDLEPVLRRPAKEAFYAVTLRPPSGVRPRETERLLADLAASSALVEVAPEPEVANLAAVSVRKFLRRRNEAAQ